MARDSATDEEGAGDRSIGSRALDEVGRVMRRRSDRRIAGGINGLLACPSCGSPLVRGGSALSCESCRASYPDSPSGVPRLLPQMAER